MAKMHLRLVLLTNVPLFPGLSPQKFHTYVGGSAVLVSLTIPLTQGETELKIFHGGEKNRRPIPARVSAGKYACKTKIEKFEVCPVPFSSQSGQSL